VSLSDLARLSDLPPGSMPISALVLVNYVDADGDECASIVQAGEATVPAMVGLLAWASHQILTGQPLEEEL
jgi:hypothetical protein